MAEPGNELVAGAGGQGRLQASHADRVQVIDQGMPQPAAFCNQGSLDHQVSADLNLAAVNETI
jgi:hypothetical protein